MKYTCEIEINQPIEKVISLFDDPKNMDKWMEGLISFEHLSGTPGQPGAKSKLKFKIGKREIEMIETVLVRNLPQEFSGSYEGNGGYNLVKNKFEAIASNKTKYSTENEFQFKGTVRVVAWLMPSLFKKQSFKYLTAFKKFAEAN